MIEILTHNKTQQASYCEAGKTIEVKNYIVLESYEKSFCLNDQKDIIIKAKTSILILLLSLGLLPIVVYVILLQTESVVFRLSFLIALIIVLLITFFLAYSKYERSQMTLTKKYLLKDKKMFFWKDVIQFYLVSKKPDNPRLSDKSIFVLNLKNGEKVEIETEELNFKKEELRDLILKFWSSTN